MKCEVQWVRVICPLCSNLGLLLCAGKCLNQQGIPELQLYSPAGMMCEMCGFLCLSFVVVLSLSLASPLFLCSSFPGMALWQLAVVGWVVLGTMSSELAAAALAAHCLSSLPLQLPVGFEKTMVLTGKEREGKKRTVLARKGFNRENVWIFKRKWAVCWNISGEWWVHYWNLNGAGAGWRLCEFWVTGVGLCIASTEEQS